jgi:hypothetical protein
MFWLGNRAGLPETMERSMSNETMHWYRSKVDWWLGLILCIPPIASAAICISFIRLPNLTELPWAAGGVLFVLGIYFGLVFPMKYGLDETYLLVRFGVCRKRIPLADVTEVYPTHNPLSSPALSLDRLHIQFGKGLMKAVMISPADRDGFLDDLAGKTGLTRQGGRLVRL